MDALDPVLEEEAFYVRIQEIYNDLMHTDAMLDGDAAIDALDEGRFLNKRWCDLLRDEEMAPNRDLANDAAGNRPPERILQRLGGAAFALPSFHRPHHGH